MPAVLLEYRAVVSIIYRIMPVYSRKFDAYAMVLYVVFVEIGIL